jgi:hypothetical protein
LTAVQLHFEFSQIYFPHDEWLQAHLAKKNFHAGNIELATIQFKASEQSFPLNLWGTFGHGLICEAKHQRGQTKHKYQQLVCANPDDFHRLARICRA